MKGDRVGKNNPMYGKRHTQEAKDKLRDKRKGKKMSQETKDKLSVAGCLRIGEKSSFYGRKHSIAARSKIGAANHLCIGEKNGFYGKKHNPETLDILSLKACERFKKGSNIKTKYITLRNSSKGKVIIHSSYEAAFLYIVDSLPEVSNIETQIKFIRYFDSSCGKYRRYTPDFLIKLKDGRRFLVEEKVKYLIFADFEQNKCKNRAARKFCIENGLYFRYWSEKHLNKDYIKKSLRV